MTEQRGDYSGHYANGPGADQPRVRDSTDATADQVQDGAMRALDVGGKVAEQARAYADKVQHAARNFKPFAQRAMRERPLPALAAAGVIGFVLGALWKK